MVPRLLFCLLTLGGCLERVTGEFVPLDERYLVGAKSSDATGGDQPGADGGTGGVCPTYEGEVLTVRGVVESETSTASVQIDVNVPDPEAAGGVRRECGVPLPGPGEFAITLPVTYTSVELQAFQDPEVDGPSEQDPFAALTLALEEKDPDPVTLKLVVGMRGVATGPSGGPTPGGPEHVEAAAGAPGGAAGAGGAPPPVFADDDGPRVAVSGTVQATLEYAISLDFFKHDEAAPGGRTFLFKQQVKQGAWSVPFPKGYGQIEIDAYQDPKGDGPTEGDPICHYEKNPITVGDGDVTGIDLLIP